MTLRSTIATALSIAALAASGAARATTEYGAPVVVVHDQVGCPTYTGHLAVALLRLIDSASYGIHHMAGEGSCSWYEFARAILADTSVRVTPIATTDYPTPARRPAYGVLDSSRFARTFGLALPDWRSMLGECLRAPAEPPAGFPVN